MIVINDSYRLAPWADCHYFCDPRWLDWHKFQPEWSLFRGFRITMQSGNGAPTPYLTLRNAGTNVVSAERDAIGTGRNSGFQAINLAFHLGAKRIVLLGYDMQPGPKGEIHFFGDHPTPTKGTIFQSTFAKTFDVLAAAAIERGIEIVNATRRTALKAFHVKQLEDVL